MTNADFRNILTTNERVIFRVLILLGSFGVIFFAYVLEIVNPEVERFIPRRHYISVLGLVILGLSFVNNYVKKHLYGFFVFLAYVFTIDGFYVIYYSDFAIEFLLLSLLVIVAVVNIFRKLWHLVAYLLATLISFAFFSFILSNFQPNTLFAFTTFAFMLVLLFFIGWYRIVSMKDLEAALNVKTNFLATMSHEIRTPMNAVIGMTEILQHTNLTEEQKSYADTIHLGGENLLSVINDILDYSKIESGKLELENKEFNLSESIEGVLNLASSIVKGKNLKLNYHIDDDVPNLIKGDLVRLRQILMNILGNAVKFTLEGEILISVYLNKPEGKKDTHQELHFIVKDTGIGIPDNKIKVLFDSFSQVDSSTTRKYGGTGLGLAICKKLVNLMGGKIWVESEMGVGSEFHFTIKNRIQNITDCLEYEEHKNTLQRKIKTIEPSEITAKKNAFVKILLVEDNAVNQKVAIQMLKRLGYTTDIACDGVEALKAIELNPYDLIFMDVQMPEMDGLEATKRIKHRYKDKAPIIIGMTANAMEGDREKCLNAGMDDYLAKPVQLNTINDVINKWTQDPQIKKRA